MNATPLHYVWDYNDVDRAFWSEHLESWLPPTLFDAHTHVMTPSLRKEPMTDAMRKQYWVSEVFEPIPAPDAARCHGLVFPNRKVRCLAFGVPDLDYDLDAGNDYVQTECEARGWNCLAMVRPQWSQDKVAAELAKPGVVGLKPYYALIGQNRESRDVHIEADIFDFIPHSILEVLDDFRGWLTLHVPKTARLGHPNNLAQIRELRRRYPHVVLVIAHLGRCYTEEHALEALPQLADDPGIYFDTSAVLNPVSHRLALRYFSPYRVLYGTDNPIFYMRGRRQYRGGAYVNRTQYPFQFNKEREAPEIEAAYTLYMYEDIKAIKQACADLGIADRPSIQAIFHDNAARLIASIERRKSGIIR
jgi:hypothetical protein